MSRIQLGIAGTGCCEKDLYGVGVDYEDIGTNLDIFKDVAEAIKKVGEAIIVVGSAAPS